MLEFEDFHDAVPSSASFGGMTVTDAADRVANGIALVVYRDALVSRDGQSGLDLLPEEFGDLVRAAADEYGYGWVPTQPVVLPPSGMTL